MTNKYQLANEMANETIKYISKSSENWIEFSNTASSKREKMIEYIDIIMPVYNCEKYIGSAIESVQRQTYNKWKLIIINDNSSDDTKKEIEKRLNDKILFINLKKHVGVAEARNIGIRNSENQYIAFLDADDIWLEEKLQKQLEFVKKNDYGFTYTSFTYLKDGRKKDVNKIPQSLDYKQALKNTIILTSTVLINKEKVKEIYMPNIPSEDTATWWKILKSGIKAYGLNERLTIYRITQQGLSSKKFRNLGRTWNLYRKQEGFSCIRTIYYFLWYVLNAIKKRVI